MEPAAVLPLPIGGLDWQGLIPAIGTAHQRLAHFDGLLFALPNPEILLSPLTSQEAVLSSRIEGTQATLGEVLKAEAGQVPEQPSRELDVQEIINYGAALQSAETELRHRPFTLNLLRQMHAILLNSVRGRDKGRGEFRRVQNWIGRPDSPMERADFVPPPAAALPGALDQWEKYYHATAPDALVQLALLHAQFEYLHPFLDGNGRLGRLLIPLFLYEKKLLSRPMFYLSSHLERHRDAYIAHLRALGPEAAAWQAWCAFFLAAIASQAAANTRKVKSILALYETLKPRVIELTHSQFAVILLDAIFARPIFSTSQLTAIPNTPTRPMLIALLKRMAAGGVVRSLVEGSGRRPQLWICDELMALCDAPD